MALINMTELNNIKEYLRRQSESDYIMPIWLPFLPYLLILLGLFGFFVSVLGGSDAAIIGGGFFMGILAIAGAILNIYVIYKWLSRRNNHFNRRLMIHESFADYLNELASKKDEDISGVLSSAKREIREAQREENERNSILYIVLFLVFQPILLYIFHFLNKDFVKHFRREENILEDFNNALDKLGIEKEIGNFSREYRFPERSTIIYIVLTFVTAGLFTLYWIYTLTKDPNDHFKQHQRIERQMAEVIENIE